MNVFMYVLREFENGLDYCGDRDYDEGVKFWDKGVAYYTGSSQKQNGQGTGYLLYELANKRCKNFKTCGINGDSDGNSGGSNSQVNHEFLELARIGQAQIRNADCKEARITKEKIADIMYIPLVQGTLRYAYKMSIGDAGEKEKGEGAVFAAAVLPRVFAANPDSAKIIYDNMHVGSTSTDFKVVKEAFESEYKNMNIKCDQVGGILHTEGYVSGASPCKSSSDDDGETNGDDKIDEDKMDDDKGNDDADKKGMNNDGNDDQSNYVLPAVLGSISGVLVFSLIGAAMFIKGRQKGREAPVFQPHDESQVID